MRRIKEFFLKIFAIFLGFLLFFLSLFWRVKIKGIEHFHSLQSAIYVFWHRYIPVLFPLFAFKKITILVSLSRDGEFVASIIRFQKGYEVVRGSSTRGGLSAFFSLCSALRNKKKVGIPADGPRGPVYCMKEGILLLSRRTGAPVVPVSVKVKGAISINSWDKLLIPFPFSKIEIEFHEPHEVKSVEDKKYIESLLGR